MVHLEDSIEHREQDCLSHPCVETSKTDASDPGNRATEWGWLVRTDRQTTGVTLGRLQQSGMTVVNDNSF